MKTYHNSARRGFTLIELLTVIAIIGILAAIIIPTVGKVRDTAKTAICASNIRQVGVALRLCASDRKDTFPRPFTNDPTTINGTSVTSPDWHQMVEPYLPPKDKNSWNQGAHPVMKCPGIKWDGVTSEEAGTCFSLGGAAIGLNNGNYDTSLDRRLGTVSNPSMAPLLIDGAQASQSATGKYYAQYWLRNSPGGTNSIITDVSGNTNLAADFRHGDSVNVCMVDGSVKRIKRSEWAAKYPSLGAQGDKLYKGI